MTLNPALEPSQAVNYTLEDHKETFSCIIFTHPRRLRILGDVIALMGQKSRSGGSAGRAQTRQSFGNSTDMMPIATHKAVRQCYHCAAILRHFPLNRTQNHSADPARFSRSASDRPDSTHGGGGRTLQIPVFSAMGRILLINANGSANSSQLGSNTGHSGGGVNSTGPGWVILQVRFRSRIESLSEAETELPGICNTVCPSLLPQSGYT